MPISGANRRDTAGGPELTRYARTRAVRWLAAAAAAAAAAGEWRAGRPASPRLATSIATVPAAAAAPARARCPRPATAALRSCARPRSWRGARHVAAAAACRAESCTLPGHDPGAGSGGQEVDRTEAERTQGDQGACGAAQCRAGRWAGWPGRRPCPRTFGKQASPRRRLTCVMRAGVCPWSVQKVRAIVFCNSMRGCLLCVERSLLRTQSPSHTVALSLLRVRGAARGGAR